MSAKPHHPRSVRPLQDRLFGIPRRKPRTASGQAFTLIELLIVVTIIVAMAALIAPAYIGLKSGSDLTKASYDLAGTLDQASAYALANRTYVYVGIGEFDVTKDSSAHPQSTGTGRVAVATVATRDGTKHYMDATSGQGADWQANYANPSAPEYNGGHLVAISKLLHFENLHLAASLPPPASGPMARPAVATQYMLGNPACASQTPFTWPLGSPLSSGYQYRFDKVIQFDPEGVARITYPTNGNTIVQWMEAGLQETSGAVVSTGSNVAAIQIDAMTGATRIYRP